MQRYRWWPGIVEGDVDPAAIEEAVLMIAGIEVIADDLAGIVDALGNGVARTQRIVEGGVGAGATRIVGEGVVARGVAVIPDDETRGVDARYNSAAGAEGIVELRVVA